MAMVHAVLLRLDIKRVVFITYPMEGTSLCFAFRLYPELLMGWAFPPHPYVDSEDRKKTRQKRGFHQTPVLMRFWSQFIPSFFN